MDFPATEAAGAALAGQLKAMDIGAGARLVVAFSGGADSLALLALLARLPVGSRPALEAIHVDHGLREASGADALAALEAARRLGVPARAVRVEVGRQGGIEAAARTARYQALGREAAGRRVLTAHTLDDQAETVLLRLARGAGMRGASGMRQSAVIAGARIARPLLGVRRAALHAVVRELGLEVVEDDSNTDLRFARNRLRAEVLPPLETLAPGAVVALARFAELAQADERYLAARARRAAGPEASQAVDRLLRLPLALRRRVVRDRIEAAGGPPPAAARIREVLRLLARGGDGELHLPGGVLVSVRAGAFSAAQGPTGQAARGPHRQRRSERP